MKNRVFKNASWIVGCKLIQAIISFFIGMITARYLGPSKYGLLSYAISVVAFFQPIVKLGFDSTLVHEFIDNPEEEGTVLGTALIYSISASILSVIGILVFVCLVNAGEKDTIIVCFLYSFLLVFHACDMTQYWFQAKLLSKYSAISALVSYFCISIYKIYILVVGKSVRWFTVSHVIEVAIIAALLLIWYFKLGKCGLSFSRSLGKKMLSKSKYYIWSGLMLIVFQQTDRIMLKLMDGETATGYYSAAVTCVGITAFVFAAIFDSARPSVLEGYKKSYKIFENKIMLLFSIVTYLSLMQAVFMTVFSRTIVTVFYGEKYLPSARILQVLVWYIIFGYFGMVRDIWILAEGKQKYLLKINAFGAIINIVLNYILIPRVGAVGASIASVLSQCLTNFVLCFFIKPLRPVGIMMLNSLNPKFIYGYIRGRKGL